MLLENTGSNPLDSGGVGGRHWERNQSIDFDYEPKKNFPQRLKEYFCEKIRGVSMKVKYQSDETPSLALFDLVDTDIRVMFVKEVKGRYNVSLGHIFHAYDKENVRKKCQSDIQRKQIK